MWTIALAVSGNEVGMALAEWRALAPAAQQAKRERAYARLQQCGAHYVVDSIADILPCIDDIEARIRRGDTP
jgi:phosphonoacetaldehyde hydrolase